MTPSGRGSLDTRDDWRVALRDAADEPVEADRTLATGSLKPFGSVKARTGLTSWETPPSADKKRFVLPGQS